MGSLYGQRTRALLNHDTVFLAELLSAISAPDDALKNWNHAYQSYNCLALPAHEEHMPLPLQLAATATLVLTEFKIADHIHDSKRRLWQGARRLFSKSFLDASRRLRDWQFPLDELRQALLSQQAREAGALRSNESADATLDHLAEPTAIATALFCAHGARLVGQPELQPTLHSLGHHFGAIAYLLDAIEDYERDLRRGDFNALAAAYKISAPQLPAEIRRAAAKKVRQRQAQLEALLLDLPMTAALRQMFAARLHSNLARKLGALPVLNATAPEPSHLHHKPAAQVCQRRLSISQRWNNALAFSRQIARNHRQTGATTVLSQWASRLASPVVFATVLPVAFFAPQQTTAAQSYGECMSLGLNLMFIGSVISFIVMTLGKPLRFATPQGTGFGGQMPDITDAVDASRRRRRQQGNEGGGNDHNSCCDCCDCGGCDCCPDCSCCDGCDCCGCDCN